MPRLLLISGPLQCGKSTAGRAIAGALGADHFAVSDRLKIETHRHFGLPADLAADAFEAVKDVSQSCFGGLTPRQAYIHVSEDILKPRFGDDYLGKCALERLVSPDFDLKVISGVGFIDEILPLVAAVGADNCRHIRVMPGRTHRGKGVADSRETIDLGEVGVATTVLINSFDPGFHAAAIAMARALFQPETVLEPV
jgi:hypothetical protein